MSSQLMPDEDAPHVCVQCDNAKPTDDSTLCFGCLRELMVLSVARLTWYGMLTPAEAKRVKKRIRKEFCQ